MSWQATAWAERQITGSPARKVLLLVLANYADEDGVCWPSQETLSRGTEQSVDTVQRQLRKLEHMKILAIATRPQGRGRWPGRTYKLNMSVAENTEPQTAARIDGSPRYIVGHISRGGDCCWRSLPVVDEDHASAAARILAEFVGGVVR
ncbi:helix-turn-helix domain-containing protein [Tardiphaga sp.]|uniref:helix-turn-helix domain-containing protein n=1 Tax=Tardiphaga sp. TaxID=1926292 RepID=UPI003529DD57